MRIQLFLVATLLVAAQAEADLAGRIVAAIPVPERNQFETPESVVLAFFAGIGELDDEKVFQCFPLIERFKLSGFVSDVTDEHFRTSKAALPDDRLARLWSHVHDVMYIMGKVRAELLMAKRPETEELFPEFTKARNEAGEIDEEKLAKQREIFSAKGLDGFELKVLSSERVKIENSGNLEVHGGYELLVEIAYLHRIAVFYIIVARHENDKGNYQIMYIVPEKKSERADGFDWSKAPNSTGLSFEGLMATASLSAAYTIRGRKYKRMFIRIDNDGTKLDDLRLKISQDKEAEGRNLVVLPLTDAEDNEDTEMAKEEGCHCYVDLPVLDKKHEDLKVFSNQPKGSLRTFFFRRIDLSQDE